MDVKPKVMVFSSILVILLSLKIVFASEITVRREAPTSVRFDEIFQVNIIVENLGLTKKEIIVEELVSNFEPIEPEPIIVQPNESGLILVPPPFFKWEFVLEAGESESVYYKAKPLAAGDLMLSPTKVYWNGEVTYTEPLTIKVVCNQNGLCELEKGENYLTCPEDCPSGSKDNYCDMERDGICDPDCEGFVDEDCICNQNGLCEVERGENSTNCPFDCHCGNGLCEKEFEEDYKNCPSDCVARPFDFSFVIYISIAILLILLIFILFSKIRREKESRLSLPY